MLKTQKRRQTLCEWKQRNITLKMLVFCNGDGFAWCKICIGAHTCTHIARYRITFIHSFADWLVRFRSIYLFVHTQTHTQQMLSGFTKPLWHTHAQFLLFFSLKNNHDRQQQSTHTRTLTKNAYLTETTFKNCTYYNHISIHLSFSHIEVKRRIEKKKRKTSAEHNDPSILKLH